MYCPQCGLQQVSDNIRFCSRCGLAIGGLAEWLYSGAMLPVATTPRPLLPSPRRKGTRAGAKMMFISAVLVPIFFGFSWIGDSPGPLLVPLTVFLAGFSVFLYSLLFLEEFPTAKGQLQPPATFAAPAYNQALPPAATLGVNSFGRDQIRTAELAQPPSVTENTTRLLDNEQEL